MHLAPSPSILGALGGAWVAVCLALVMAGAEEDVPEPVPLMLAVPEPETRAGLYLTDVDSGRRQLLSSGMTVEPGTLPIVADGVLHRALIDTTDVPELAALPGRLDVP